MAKIFTKDGKAFIELPLEEFKKTGLKSDSECDLYRATDGLVVLVEKKYAEKETQKIEMENPGKKIESPSAMEKKTLEKIENSVEQIGEKNLIEQKSVANAKFFEIDAKILGMLKSKKLNEKVEGTFEKLLSKEELERFNQLIEKGKIVTFKLNEKYRKAIYKSAEEFKKVGKKDSESAQTADKPIEEYSLEKDGFLVVKNEERAKRISQEFSEKIKKGEIKGTKSFDGNYYIIENSLLEKYREKAIYSFKSKKSLYLSELSNSLGISKTLARILCDFLKEDGELLEKKKELYSYIE